MQDQKAKSRSFKFSITVFSFYFSVFSFFGTVWALDDSVGSGTVPPSSTKSGLVRSPNPIDTSGNLLITGNVAGGKHFRGIVPYRATSSFGAAAGSSSLDSFLRRSTGSGNLGSYTGTYKPYYSPSGIVATTSPGRSGVIQLSTAAYLDGRSAGLVKRQARYESRPMSLSPQELKKLVSRAGESATVDEPKQKPVESATADEKDDSLRLSAKAELFKMVQQRFETQPSKKQMSENEQLDVYEQMKWEIGRFQDGLKESAVVRYAEKEADGKKAMDENGSRQSKLSEVDLYVRAKSVLGEHKTFASFSKDKFNQHLKAAENYLKQGKYYRAADAYTLASIYKLDDPLAYAGKSHALFAAGEYMSSALFLSRALEIFPDYAKFEIDLVAMVGDRDKLESRIADVEQWLKKSGAAELQFLLGYVYCQMGRLERAKEAIDAAYWKMPTPAVIALKKAIDDAIDFRLRGNNIKKLE